MRRMGRFTVMMLALSAGSGFGQMFWINELHYDNAGTDAGEFVEVAVPTGFADLASITLTLYNGGDGTPYGSHSLSTFARGTTTGGIDLYSKLISGIQNGAPDGLVLDAGGSVLQFVSYEGSFTASAGPAAGLISTDLGVVQPDAGAPVGTSLGLAGLGSQYADFSWAALGVATPGDVNDGQSVVPEPREYALMAGGALGIFALWRSWRARVASTAPAGVPTPGTAAY